MPKATLWSCLLQYQTEQPFRLRRFIFSVLRRRCPRRIHLRHLQTARLEGIAKRVPTGTVETRRMPTRAKRSAASSCDVRSARGARARRVVFAVCSEFNGLCVASIGQSCSWSSSAGPSLTCAGKIVVVATSILNVSSKRVMTSDFGFFACIASSSC
eukprot:COSAG02_NODE_1219_length_13812_cov_108.713629_7_plen_157_part_00